MKPMMPTAIGQRIVAERSWYLSEMRALANAMMAANAQGGATSTRVMIREYPSVACAMMSFDSGAVTLKTRGQSARKSASLVLSPREWSARWKEGVER